MNSMLNKFREYLVSSGIKESTADVYLSVLRSSSKRKGSKISGWASVSQWAAKFILEHDVPRLDVPNSVESTTGLYLVSKEPTEPIVVRVFSEDTLDDIENVLSMQLDSDDKIKILTTYISSRKRDLMVMP